MAVGDYFQVRLRQRYLNKNLDNVAFYIQTDATVAGDYAEELANAFWDRFAVPFSDLQSTGLSYEYLDVINLNDDFESYRLDLTGNPINNGTLSGEGRAEWDALVFTKRPQNRQYKVGLWRVRGMTEAMNNNITIEGAFSTPILAMQVAIDDNLTGDTAGAWSPIILRRIRIPQEGEFIAYSYSHSAIAGVRFAGFGHKVNNQ